jgi:acetamidase/formamidase
MPDRTPPTGDISMRPFRLAAKWKAVIRSPAADLRITQVVNENKGVHLMLAKRYLAQA